MNYKKINYVRLARTRKPGKKFVVDAYDGAGARVRRYFEGRTEADQFCDRKRQEFESAATILELTDDERQGVILARSERIPLLQAVQAQVAHREAEAASDNTTVQECVAGWLAQLKLIKRSERHRKTIEQLFSRLEPKWGDLPVRTITSQMVAAEVHGAGAKGKGVSDSTKASYRRLLHGFFAYAVEQRIRPDNPAKEVKKLRSLTWTDQEIGILTPEQSRDLIAAAAEHAPALLPAVAIGLFAGLRVGEIERLSWKEVWLERGLIVVTAGKSKTSSRRMVTIEPCLAALLEGRKPSGDADEQVWPPNAPRLWDRAIKAAGWRGRLHWQPKADPAAPMWPENALRHSFVSYHVATFMDVARTALEAGHSVEMLHRHYRQLVTAAAGEEYWTLRLENATTERHYLTPDGR